MTAQDRHKSFDIERMDHNELLRNPDPLLTSYGVEMAKDAPSKALMFGQFRLQHGVTGMTVHAADLEAERDFSFSFSAPAGLHVMVQLQGRTEFSLGNVQVCLDARSGPRALLRRAPAPTQVIRTVRRGERTVKATITVCADWFAGQVGPQMYEQIMEPAQDAPLVETWSPNPEMTQAARQLVDMPNGDGLSQRLSQDRIGLVLLHSALSWLESGPSEPVESQSAGQRLQAALDYMSSHLNPALTTERIAQALGMSTRVLERLFREQTGQSVGAYRREMGLTRGRDGIESGKMTVAQAAWAAGYKHPSSFSAAFQKRFGKSPSELL